MVTLIYQTLAQKAESKDVDKLGAIKAREWYRAEALKIKDINQGKIIDPKNIRSTLSAQNIGQMFMFFYDPKHKETLQYYDRFPLVFPVQLYEDGFLGVNMHYLPPKFRAMLMDALYITINNNKNDKTTRLRLSYEILQNSTRMRYFKPCLKKYLFDQVLQKFLYIDTKHWDKALMLPTERFVKKKASHIHAESVRSINGR